MRARPAEARPRTNELAATLRALPAMMRTGFAEAVAYRSEMVVWLLAYSTPLIMLALFTAVAREGDIGGFDARAFQAYFLLTLVVRVATGSWVAWELNWEVRQGLLAKRLLKPVHPLLSFATGNLAAIPLRVVLILPILGATLAWLGPSILVADPVQRAIMPLSLAGAWCLWFCSMAILGTLALYLESSLSVVEAWLAVSFVFSGYVLPLSLYPESVQSAIAWLPFPYLLSFPVANALGHLDRTEALRSLGAQWAHVALHLAVLLVLWRRGIRRFEAFGG